jgi:hypothetical protein
MEKLKDIYRPSLFIHYQVLCDFQSAQEYLEECNCKDIYDFAAKFTPQEARDLVEFYEKGWNKTLRMDYVDLTNFPDDPQFKYASFEFYKEDILIETSATDLLILTWRPDIKPQEAKVVPDFNFHMEIMDCYEGMVGLPNALTYFSARFGRPHREDEADFINRVKKELGHEKVRLINQFFDHYSECTWIVIIQPTQSKSGKWVVDCNVEVENYLNSQTGNWKVRDFAYHESQLLIAFSQVV